MSLFGNDPWKNQLGAIVPVGQSLIDYQQALMQWQMGAMGQPAGMLGQYGPAGMMQRQGLSTAKATPLLPEEFVVSALVGWRRWSVTMFGEELQSNNGTKWQPYERLAAKCGNDGPHGLREGCKGLACGCGIYAYKERPQAEHGENAPKSVTHVWGEVHLWGRVVEHEQGYRAQFAYPKAFINSGGIAQRMATIYGVKVIS